MPEMAAGAGLTVTVANAEHPVGSVYVITAVPPEMPVTAPEPEPTVATPVAPVLHVPPPASVNVVISPGQMTIVPEIALTALFTVTVVNAVHPVGSVYVISDVPGDAPITMPVPEPMVAIVVLPLLHVPPPASVSVVVPPTHMLVVPLMADGKGFTVSVVFVVHPVDDKVNVIRDVPDDTPDTVPLDEPIEATEVLLLLHVPEPEMSLSVVAEDTHTLVVPVIVAGAAVTETMVVAIFPGPPL
jgi:hypothetical protein